jgi:DNA invertase Pin-like site-specific DNA recombinase
MAGRRGTNRTTYGGLPGNAEQATAEGTAAGGAIKNSNGRPQEAATGAKAWQATEPPKPKAYSYVRFSTPEQAQGDSYRRQTQAAQEYARLRGLELDTELTFADLGKSAFRGANAKTGALAKFLEAVKDEAISKGSYLLVENLDRLTRADVLEAQELFTGIIRRGITLVTLFDQKSYSAESVIANPTDLVFSILIMIRGHEESATKSRRMQSVYEKKRAEAATNGGQGKPFTRMLPGWLRWSPETQRTEVIKERTRVLRSIFKKADAGWSKHRIARWLNGHRVDTWGEGKRKAEFWHSSYVQKVLTNRAVIGTFTPHRVTKDNTGARKRKPLDPIEGYWPAVIDRDLFDRVEAQAKATAARGRNAVAEPRSMFAGVIKCGRCGGAVVRSTKGKYVYLVCSRANAKAGCEYQAVRYAHAEHSLRVNAKAIIEYAPRGRDTAEMDEELRRLDNGVTELIFDTRELVDELVADRSEAARRRLREKEDELEAAQERLRELRTRRDTLAEPSVQRRLAAVQAALEREAFNVVEANTALKQAVEKIVMKPESGTAAIHWWHTEEPQEVPLYSRHYKPFDVVEEGWTVTAHARISKHKGHQ